MRLFDDVQKLLAPVETFVSPRPQLDEGEAEEMKRGLKTLTGDENEKPGKLEHHALDSSLDSTHYPDTLKHWMGK